MKLDIELVPSSTWYVNLRTAFKSSAWSKIRKQVVARAKGRCEICNQKASRLECHEKWNYDTDKREQKLIDILALCCKCHHIKHFGRSLVNHEKEKINIDGLVDHFMKVNNCSYAEFEKHVEDAFKEFHIRSREEWTVEISEVEKYLI